MFKRLLELSKRTGDRIVFADVEKDEAYVVLALEDYEKLVLGLPPKKEEVIFSSGSDKNGKETINKINALDEISREVVKTLEAERIGQASGRMSSVGDELELETEERYYLEPIE